MPLENTLSQLTQAIRFLAANDFLQGVEAYAGEADERERDRNKITVVGETNEDAANATPAAADSDAAVETAEEASPVKVTEIAAEGAEAGKPEAEQLSGAASTVEVAEEHTARETHTTA